jgi:hypothetical protein
MINSCPINACLKNCHTFPKVEILYETHARVESRKLKLKRGSKLKTRAKQKQKTRTRAHTEREGERERE